MDQIEGPWSPEEDEMLENLFEKHGFNWSIISNYIPGRSDQSCRSRFSSLNRPFTPVEDEMMHNLVEKHGPNWKLIGKSIPARSGKSCWSRWSFVHRPFTLEEDNTVIQAHARFGNDWDTIGRLLGGRTDHVIKNRWNSTLKWKSSSMTNEDIGAYNNYIPPPSFSDMTRDNVSRPSGGTHSYSRDRSAPSWNALNKRDSSIMMIDSDNVQEFVGNEFGWNEFPESTRKRW